MNTLYGPGSISYTMCKKANDGILKGCSTKNLKEQVEKEPENQNAKKALQMRRKLTSE